MQEKLKKERAILEVLSNIYIFIVLIIYPLIVDSTGFFKILECKWHSYIIIASAYIFSIVGVILYYCFFEKTNYLKQLKLSIVQWLAISYLLINILSCFLSPFFKQYNLFVKYFIIWFEIAVFV